MPVSYCFKGHDGKMVPRIDIEAEVCKMVGKQVDPVDDCIEFQIMELFGLAASFEDGKTTKDNVEAVICKHDDTDHATEDLTKTLCRYFLYEHYTFESWR